MNRNTRILTFKRWLGMALLAPYALRFTSAATPEGGDLSRATSSSMQLQADEELDEVLVEGHRVGRNPQNVIDWLARLVGQFTYDGHVEFRGKGNREERREVHGGAICVGFGPAPAVQCEIKVNWPEAQGANGEELLGGVSNLDPAMMLFGFEPDHLGVRYMLVDSKGIAEGALGKVIGDTLESEAPCVNVPGDCQRIVRITAAADLKVIETQVDIVVDLQRVVRFSFVQKRVPGSSAVVMPGEPGRSRR